MRARRLIGAIVALVLVGVLIAAGLIWWAGDGRTPFTPEECTATVDGNTTTIDLEQAMHASTIAAVAERRGLPARAVTIALATAYQESDLYNIDYGDRDSLGLFQQRPSQGWGTPEQVQDPVYSANAFYDGLEKISGYRNLEITVAAQQVQRSGFPEAYADHEADARVLASALSGNSTGVFACTFDADPAPEQTFGDDGQTDRARTLSDELTSAFGELSLAGFQPGGVTSGHIEGSAHYEGRAVDIMFEPHTNAEQNRRGWTAAHWAVANAKRLGVSTVIYDDQIWTARRSAQGWRAYTHPSGETDDPTLRHLDHVHIDVH